MRINGYTAVIIVFTVLLMIALSGCESARIIYHAGKDGVIR